MAKITRTITTYIYKYGKSETTGSGVVQIVPVGEVRSISKLGPRSLEQARKAQGIEDDCVMYATDRECVLYGMELEEFMKYAQPINKGDDD